MKKRIAAFLIAAVCILGTVASCHDRKIDGEVIKGAEINIYLCEQLYELDPALCLNNDSALQICGLLYDTLFKLDSKGKITGSIAEKYEIKKDVKNDEYTMQITLRKDNKWSDGVNNVSADDVVFAWKRILDPSFNSEAACLLYDIKNARTAKEGDCSIDDVGIYADSRILTIVFNGDVDYDRFLLNLTSVALAPLREDIIVKNADWSKKPATTASSGAFMIRRVNYGFDTDNYVNRSFAQLILERNPYYRRAKDAKYVDTSVDPFRLIINYNLSKEELLKNYLEGTGKDKVFYIGDIPLSVRSQYASSAEITDLMSTFSFYLNENADISGKDGTKEKLFANKNVRLALSAAIDRQAIADSVVFAKAATAIVPYGVFEDNSPKSLFREVGGQIIPSSADMSAARDYLSKAGINASDYSFTISVKAYDEVHSLIANAAATAWKELGFNVTVAEVAPEINDEKFSGEDVKDIFDDIFDEKFYAGKFEVAGIDLIAGTPDAISVLAPFATPFSGQGQEDIALSDISNMPHKTGYVNESYNELMEKVFIAESGTERAELLHQAEKMLLEDMPVIPVIFNQNATLISSDLRGVEMTYYGYHLFTNVSQKNYINYIETEEITKEE